MAMLGILVPASSVQLRRQRSGCTRYPAINEARRYAILSNASSICGGEVKSILQSRGRCELMSSFLPKYRPRILEDSRSYNMLDCSVCDCQCDISRNCKLEQIYASLLRRPSPHMNKYASKQARRIRPAGARHISSP